MDEKETMVGVFLEYQDNTDGRSKGLNIPDNICLRLPDKTEEKVGLWGKTKGVAPIKPKMFETLAPGAFRISLPVKRSSSNKGKEYVNVDLERITEMKVLEKLATPEPVRATNDDYWRKKLEFEMLTHRGEVRRSALHAAVELHVGIFLKPGFPSNLADGSKVSLVVDKETHATKGIEIRQEDVVGSVINTARKFEAFFLEAEPMISKNGQAPEGKPSGVMPGKVPGK